MWTGASRMEVAEKSERSWRHHGICHRVLVSTGHLGFVTRSHPLGYSVTLRVVGASSWLRSPVTSSPISLCVAAVP
jgi:hypothetical protein